METKFHFQISRDTIPADPVKIDSLPAKYQPSRQSTYKPADRFGDPFSNKPSASPLLLGDPSQLALEIDTAMDYTIYERIGDLNYRPTTTMSFEEFSRYQEQTMLKNYWKSRSEGLDGESAVSGRRLIPPIYISPVFDRIFGGSFVDIRPSGFVTLDFGGRFQRIDNPSIPVRQQRNGGFEFDQQMSFNVVGKVGEKLAITANFDNNNSFNFENDLKVEYTGFNEDIIKKIEIGNVSMPINNSLITGAQNLFGIKTQLQFGRLFVTGVASTQRGKGDVIELEGGAQGKEFQVRASDYDENRHFFLGHFFRDNYGIDRGDWLSRLPQVTSGVNVTRLEVYVINRNNNTETLRNIVAFMDLGEGRRIYRDDLINSTPGQVPGATPNNIPTANGANNLYELITNRQDIRDVDRAGQILEDSTSGSGLGLVKARDFEKINGARKLSSREYTFNSKLGFISLFRKLQNDEVLAVAFEYTYNGQAYQVGELTENHQNRPEDEVIFLKLLRPSKINTRVPTWDLMMKNIYSLNASQISREGFQLRIIYRDDNTGQDNPSLHEGRRTKDVPILRLVGLDTLNQANDPQPDGNFDFIEGVTINEENGTVIFPVLEPFGAQLQRKFDADEVRLVNKYVYNSLYETTKADAEQIAAKNKFYIVGKFQAGSSSEIILPGINIAENSVRVMAGNTPLVEGVDYTVDYNLGKVSIINQAVLISGKKIVITYEKADLFNFQTRSLMGARFDYLVNPDFNLGATLLYLNERPAISRVNIGDEPIRNTKIGFDINYRKDSRFLTKMVDALPFIQTKEPSTITFNAEFAQLLPGTSNKVDGEGASYIDDFESAITPFNLGGNIQSWKLASTPVTNNNQFDLSTADNPLGFTHKRAKMSWYVIDNVFYRSTGRNKPSNITDADLNNHYTREVFPQEVFKNFQRTQVQLNATVFDLAYFPEERGQYNFNPILLNQPLLNQPQTNFGGISRAITSDVDFDKTNIEYVEFWMMDPFIQGENGRVLDGRLNQNNTTGGEFVLNLGSISEDVMRDDRHAFESGLPSDYASENVSTTAWGRVPAQQFLTNAFDNSTSSRPNQDVGLDGLKTVDEAQFFFDRNPDGLPAPIGADPAGDDFKYYLGPELDQANAKIVERYKNFNGMENNSPVLGNSSLNYTPSGSNTPDNEDLNNDNTISSLEEYYEYKINMRPGQLEVGKNYVVDKVTDVSNRAKEPVDWYLFRIPIRQPDNKVGDIEGFKSIRFVRAYLTGFQQPVVLRLLKFQLVGSQWRRYEQSLQEQDFAEPREPIDPKFTVSVVNIEENAQGGEGKTPYVLPPGIIRDRDNTSTVERQLNEQSIQLCVEDMEDKDARAVFKNVNLDLINYGRLKMFLHADSQDAKDDDVTAFIRLGTDFDENYYEIEVPLIMTPYTATDPQIIWPVENEIDFALDDLYTLKARRDRANWNLNLPFTERIGKYNVTVEGRPDLSSVQTLMIGVRNPGSLDGASKSLCIWANELRVTDFDRTPGWAANARMNAKLADFMNITASGRYTSFGFGSVQQRIAERTREETTEFDVSANITLDKLLPEQIGLKIPMYVSYETTQIRPHFDPLDPDVPLESALSAIETVEERNNYEDIVQDKAVRRSINFTNVRKVKTKEDAISRFYDIENLAFTYAYSDMVRTNISTESYDFRSYKGAVSYNFAPKEVSFSPLKNAKWLNSPYLQIIKDFNISPVPSNLAFRADLDRRFVRTQLRNSDLTTLGIDPTFEKFFTFNRIYNLRWNLTKGLNLDYNARANAIIDEPEGDINNAQKRDSIWNNVKNLGRMKNYDQSISLNYRLPLDKIPFTDWIAADANYAVNYSWTAGSVYQIEALGNTIQNNRTQGITSKIDLVKLYNKVKILKDINSPPRKTPLAKNVADTTAQKPDMKFLKGVLKTLMSVKSININYSVREGTLLPGFQPRAFLFGMDSAFNGPGLPFILGSQATSIKRKAVENNWLAESPDLTTPFRQNSIVDLNIRAMVEPLSDLRIQIDLRKQKSSSYQENFRYDTLINDFNTLTPSRSGSYSISYLTLRTAFQTDDSENNSPVFRDFERYRAVIKGRLDNVAEGEIYNLNSRDVMIPAFLAAYAGKDATKIKLTPFPTIPLPNWNVNYAGLSKMAMFNGIFSSINLTHAYSSVYDVSNYTSSLLYDETQVGIDNDIEDYQRATQRIGEGDLVPVYLIDQVIIAERFAPLIGINIKTKSRLTAKVEYRTERNLALNLSNSQLTELNRKDIVMEIGYIKAGLKIPFKIQGETKTLENDLNFRLAIGIGDSRTVQRKIDGINAITSGNISFQLRPTINYLINQRLSLDLYFERNINEPRVSNSFKRATTAFGTRVRFSLTQ